MSEQTSVEKSEVKIPATVRSAQSDCREKMFNELTADEQIAIILKRHREIVSSLVVN